MVEQKGCMVDFYGDEMKTKQNQCILQNFLKYGKGPNLSLKMMIAET